LAATGGGEDGKVRESKKPRRRPDELLFVLSFGETEWVVARGVLSKDEEDASKKPRRNPESSSVAAVLLAVRI
jgi:hypothetical protein